MSLEAVVVKSTGSWYELEGADGQSYRARLRGRFKLDLEGKKITNPIAVGDRVVCEPDRDGAADMAITEILPRRNYILRKSTHRAHQSHMLAANLDQVALVVTVALPATSLGFIDRYLATAESYRIPAVLLVNKIDLESQIEGLTEAVGFLQDVYEPLGYRVLPVSATEGKGLDQVRDLLSDRLTLLSGHSGVGKSSLVNALSPGLDLRTAAISDFARKGVHTTTFAHRHELWPGAYIIDTPGIKELGLAEIAPGELSHYFPEMRERLNQCRFHNCRHLQEPGCAVTAAVESGDIAETRYESYLSMMADEDNRR